MRLNRLGSELLWCIYCVKILFIKFTKKGQFTYHCRDVWKMLMNADQSLKGVGLQMHQCQLDHIIMPQFPPDDLKSYS